MVSQMEGIIDKVNYIILRSSAPSERSPTSAWKELTLEFPGVRGYPCWRLQTLCHQDPGVPSILIGGTMYRPGQHWKENIS